MAKTATQTELEATIEMTEKLISDLNSMGYTRASSMLQYWRDGGSGRSRSETSWTDMFGNSRRGMQIPNSLLWPSRRDELEKKLLASHRPVFINGIRRRLNGERKPTSASDTLGPGHWKATLMYAKASGNWEAGDLQLTLGSCTIHSLVEVEITKVMRGGQAVAFQTSSHALQVGDEVTGRFNRWAVTLNDRYNWTHGTSGVNAKNLAGNLWYLLRFRSWDNPQKVLRDGELRGMGDSPKFVGKPFDIRTTPEVELPHNMQVMAPFTFTLPAPTGKP